MRTARLSFLALGLLLVTGCDQMRTFRPGPEAPPPKPARSEIVAPSQASIAAKAYYARVEESQLTRGLLREDGGGPDAPFDARRLDETFRTIAFAREFTDVGTALVRQEQSSILHRWTSPIRVKTEFGASVQSDQREADRAMIEGYVTRLSRVTRHPMMPVETNANFTVLVLAEDERQAIGPSLRRLLPEIRQREIDLIENLPQSTYCVVVASDPGNTGEIARAVAVIRSELPDRLRRSCVHEEIAQGLGLANDSPRARPSIFNDDDEFGRLTAMDELMLRMLYDPQLTPGMTADEAMPMIQTLANALTAPGS